MNKINTKAEPSAPATAFDWTAALVTVLVAAAAFGAVAAQFSDAQDPENQTALANLDKRVPLLEQATNAIQRDELCVPLSAYGCALDSALDPTARVFLTGMLGPTNDPATGYYFFLRHYLFPRDVEISLGKVSYGEEGFEGPVCDSPAVLKTNGFDLVIIYSNNQMQLLPLTPKGVPKSQ